MMYVIKRENIPTINSIEVDGHIHDLGLLKDFRKHPLLAQFLPELARISLSWVRLEKGQQLNAHKHPTTSMIIITDGYVTTIGDTFIEASAGDIILIPPNVLHGFIGGEPDGLWGLSVQFEGEGLYESIDYPRVNFLCEEDHL
ncbi:MAG: cupin domain-containing protein [Legionellaceae bacterium]|nr:cupin domain-containing protein [Legionellaceae bacterium]